MKTALTNIHLQRVERVRTDDGGCEPPKSFIEFDAKVGLNSGNKREEVKVWMTRSQALTLAMGLLTALAKRA